MGDWGGSGVDLAMVKVVEEAVVLKKARENLAT
jgi:hypothetical protein